MLNSLHRLALVMALVTFLLPSGVISGETESPPAEPTPATQLPSTTVPPPAAEPVETTEVQGTPPQDIVGRWVAASQARLPGASGVRPLVRMWEIRQGPDHLEVTLRRANVPEAVNDKVIDATAAKKPWTPTEEDLRLLAEQWDQLPPVEADYKRIENKVLSADAYPPAYNSDEVTKDSRFAIVMTENFSGSQPVIRNFSIYAIRESTPTVLSGTFVLSTLAAAPFPIPITLKGDFQAYRLTPSPPRGLLQRLFDLFAGCRRR